MKKVALGIAAAILGVSGVAGATMGVSEILNSNNEGSVSLKTDQLAANCWALTGGAQTASCSTSGAGLPDVANLVDGIDLPDASGLLASVTGATGGLGLPGVPSLSDATGLLGAVPSACSTSLPVDLPIPFGAVTSTALSLADQVNAFVNNLPVPVAIPNLGLPVDAGSVLSTVKAQAGCLGAQGGELPIAAPCGVSVPGLPVGLPATPVDGIIKTVTAAVSSVAGVSTNADNTVGVDCAAQLPAVPSLAAPSLPLPTALPGLPVPAGVPSVQSAVDTVASTVNGVTGGALAPVTEPLGGVLAPVTETVNGLVNGLPVSVPNLGLPVINCSANASTSGGLLGGLTGLISGTCK